MLAALIIVFREVFEAGLIVGIVLAVTGSESEIALVSYDEAFAAGFEDMYRRVPDTTKVSQLIGWSPTRSLEDIVRDVVSQHERPRV